MSNFTGSNNNDTLTGAAGIDTFNGLGGDDLITTGGGNDTVFGGNGDDTINAGSGDEQIDGGDGWDRVSYASATAGVNANLGTGLVTGGSGTDNLGSIEFIEGSAYNDTLTGTAGSDDLEGGAGDDLIDGGANPPGDEFDAAFYTHATSAVNVNLATGLATGGAGNDTLIGIEAVIGSNYNDTLTGSTGNEAFAGGQGNDSIVGGGGFDLAAYIFATGGVSASLVTNSSSGADGVDTLVGISGLIGGEFNDTLTGNDSANLLNGKGGNDLLLGNGGDDTVIGGTGSDTIAGGAGNDLLQGDDPDDGSNPNDDDVLDYSAAGSPMTINLATGIASGGGMGTDTVSGFEVVIGSAYNDSITSNSVLDSDSDVLIVAGAGNDTIVGGAGFDILVLDNTNGGVVASMVTGTSSGGAGNDQFSGIEALVGSQFNDTLTADDSGNNVLVGGLGNDSLVGGAGADDLVYYGTANGLNFASAGVNVNLATGVVTGGAGNDTLVGIEGVEGSDYDDTLTGTDGSNELAGGLGNDSLTAAGGDDDLRGNAGNDTLRGGAGNDNLHGGSGNDLIDGGADTDTVAYYNQDDETPSSGIMANLATGAVTGGWGNDTLVGIENLLGSTFADSVTGSAGGNYIDAGDGDDTVDGGDGDDQLYGGNGTDTVSFASATSGVYANLQVGSAAGVSGNDFLSGFERILGSGFNDTLTGNFSAARIDGGAGADSITGGNGNDTLLGGDDNDTVAGGFGDDSLFGGNGNDSLQGGDGFDTLKGDAGDDTLDGGTNINGSTFDMADYRGATSAVTVTLGGFAGTGTATGGGVGTDTLINIEGAFGSDFNDSLTGSDTGDMFSGQAGDDTLDGAGGFDLVHYGFANSAFNTAATGVTVNLATGIVSGGWGNDRLVSIEGVIGSVFGDAITGDANGNFFRGGLGDDTIDGGGGRDTAAYDFSSGSTRASLVTNTATGANGNDVLSNIENLRGGEFNDTLEGDNLSNQLEGRAGDDLLIGNAGNDTLNGELGNDTILGGAGADVVNGGAGNDRLDGGLVADRINLDDGNSLNFGGAFQAAQLSLHLGMANDGQNGQDTLAIDTFNFITGTSFNDLLVGRSGGLFEQFDGGLGDDIIDGGRTVEADRTDTARVTYQSAGSAVQVNLAAGTATGGGGNDTLINITQVRGSQSNDVLTGSDRTDLTEVFEGRAGADTIHGGGGFDMVRYTAAVSAVSVNLVTGTATDGESTVSTDTFDGIEGVRGSNFNDVLTGGLAANGTTNRTGLEFFQGEGGNDTIDGGQGYDRADYTSSRLAVRVDLAAGTALDGFEVNGVTGVDTLLNIEAVRGSANNDTLLGSNADYESFEGRSGNDSIDGLGGTDRADYQFSLGSVVANLTTGTASDGDGGTDTLLNIEDLRGSGSFGDSLTGSSVANLLDGQGGNDTLIGLDGADTLLGGDGDDLLNGGLGDDSLVGGAGSDMASYADASGAVAVNLGTGSATGADGNDTLAGIEGIRGSAYDDQLTGDAQANVLAGGAGSDTLTGGAGTDRFVFDVANPGDVDRVTDLTTGERLNFGTDLLNGQILSGNDGSALLAGQVMVGTPSGGVTRLYVGTDNVAGADRVIDLVGTYNATDFGVDVLKPGDLLYDTALAAARTLTGTTGRDTLVGGNDNDTLSGSGSGDLLLGGAGNDSLDGGTSADTLEGGAGNDTLNGGNGLDMVRYTNATAGVVVHLGTGVVTGGDGNDTLIAVERVTGSRFADSLTAANSGGNEMDGGAGDDTLVGGTGDDSLIGGLGSDTMTGDAGIDNFRVGPGGVDRITDLQVGESLSVEDYGFVLSSITNGNDASALGLGQAMVGTPSGGVTRVYLGLDSVAGADAVVDLVGIFSANSFALNLHTASYGGPLTYSTTANQSNYLVGGSDMVGGNLDDVLIADATTNGMDGGLGNDSLQGGINDDYMFGGLGSDTIDGGAGNDTIDYDRSAEGLQLNLSLGTAAHGIYTDIIRNVENIGGSAFSDRLIGNDVNNTLWGDRGNDLIEGGLGNDNLSGQIGDDWLNGGDGDDTLTGGDGNDTLSGGNGNDTYVLQVVNGGIDRIMDLGAGDRINVGIALTSISAVGAVGEPTPDQITAGQVKIGANEAGLTRLYIGTDSVPGADVVVELMGTYNPSGFTISNSTGLVYTPMVYLPGGPGNDTLSGGTTDDLIDGQGGDDSLMGQGGNDSLVGGDGNDVLDGGDGNDTLDGGNGADTLRGGNGNDSILGGAGVDFIQGGQGVDSYDGGADNDVVLFEDGVQSVVINLLTNQVINDGWGNAETIVNVENLHGSSQGDTIQLGNVGGYVFGRAGADSLTGGTGNDNLIGGSGNDTLTGGAGFDNADYFNDTYDAGGPSIGGVTVNLAAGTATDNWGHTDTLISIENISGSALADTLTGDAGTNFIFGNAGADSIAGGDGNDTLRGGSGNDTLNGGNGSDFAVYNGETNDAAGAATQGAVVNLAAGTATDNWGHTDTLISIENASGGGMADVLTGDGQNNFLNGNGGNDSLYGGSGEDTLRGGAGDDLLDGQGNLLNNQFDYADYRDATGGVTVNLTLGTASGAGIGNDTLVNIEGALGSNFGDSLIGTAVRDLFNPEGGDDTIDGGGDFDIVGYWDATGAIQVNLATGVVTGGSGNDTLISIEGVLATGFADVLTGTSGDNFFRGYAGNDTIDGGAGNDRASYDFGTGAVQVSLVTNTSSGSEGVDTLISIEHLRGGNFNDVLEGNDGANSLQGRGGNDTITGLGGSDTLEGEDGDDLLLGGAGRDTLIGGAGSDTMDGGVVTDFQNYTDGNSLSYSSSTAGIVMDLQTGSVQDGLGGVDTVSNMHFITGSAFNDVLTGSTHLNFEMFEGGAGDDTIDGGAITDGLQGLNGNRANYQNAGAAVTVNLTTGTASGAATGNDTLININGVRGSSFDDTLTGSDFNFIRETFEGRAGNDVIDGKGGLDEVRYDTTQAVGTGVNVNLATGTAQDGWGTVDTLTNIEGIRGSDYDDTLTGGNTANGTTARAGLETFQGRGGNDLIDGGVGFDRVEFSSSPTGVTVVLGGTGTGTAQDGWGGVDTLLNIEGIRGSDFADSLTGSDSGVFESFEGREGNDTINGMGGADEVVYTFSTGAVNVNLVTGAAQDGYGGTDTLSNIEEIKGSRDFSDTLTGNDVANLIFGDGGNDTLVGNGGSDTLDGGTGDDELAGGAGDDLLMGGDGTDAAVYAGALADYSVGVVAGGTRVVHLAGNEGSDLLLGVEQLRFSDGTITAPVLGLRLTADTGAVGDGLTSNGQVQLTGLGQGAAWEFSTDAGAHWTSGSGSSFTLAEGSYGVGAVQVRLADAVDVTANLAGVVTVDVTAPTVLSFTTDASAPLGVGQSATLSLVFSSVVDGLTASDLVDSKGGSFSNLATSDGGITWSAVFTPNGDRLGPASVQLSGAYTDLAGNAGSASAALSISYAAQATASDGYISGGEIWLDVDNSGTINAGDVQKGLTGADGSVAITLSAGEDAHALLVRGGTDISTGRSFDGLMKAPAGSTMLSPLTTLLVDLVQSGGATSVADAQAKLSTALGLPTGIDLTSYDPLDVVVTQSATSSAQDKAVALDIQAKTLAVANLLVTGAAALQGAAASGQTVSADAAGSAVLSALVDQIAAASGGVDLTHAATLSTVLSAAAADASIASALDVAKQADAVSAVSNVLATANQTIAAATDAAAAATSTSDLLASLSTAVAVQSVVQGSVGDQLAAGQTANLPADVAALNALTQQVDVSQLQLTSNQAATADTTPPPAPSLALHADTGSSSSDGITTNGTVDVGGLEAGARWEYSTNGGTSWTAGTGSSFLLAEGSYGAGQVQARQTDAAGNQSGVGQSAGALTVQAGVAVDVLAYSWKAHTVLSDVQVQGGSHSATTGADGAARWEAVTESDLAIGASRAVPQAEASATDQAVNLQDAIAVLRMVVGLDINGAGRPLSGYQAFAADFDANGQVGLSDAIGILRHVVGLNAPTPQWLLFDQTDTSVASRAGLQPGTAPDIHLLLNGSDARLGLVGVLRGDVDGSYAGADGAADLDQTQPNYFSDLAADKHIDPAQFGIYP